jgi:hypothetical protein
LYEKRCGFDSNHRDTEEGLFRIHSFGIRTSEWHHEFHTDAHGRVGEDFMARWRAQEMILPTPVLTSRVKMRAETFHPHQYPRTSIAIPHNDIRGIDFMPWDSGSRNVGVIKPLAAHEEVKDLGLRC